MTVGNLIQINAMGPEDLYLYGNPQTTYFKQVYKRSTNFSTDYYKLIDNQLATMQFGSTAKIRIPFNGDLLGGIYLKVYLKDIVRTDLYYEQNGVDTNYDPHFTSYVNGIGYNMIDEIKFYINGQLIEKLNGELINLINEFQDEYNKKRSFYQMTHYYFNEFQIGFTNVKDLKICLPIPFFFCRNPSQMLPLCALKNSEITLEIKLKPLNKCLIHNYQFTDAVPVPSVNGWGPVNFDEPNGPTPGLYNMYDESVTAGIESFEIFTESIFLEKSELNLFKNQELCYLLDIFNVGSSDVIQNPSSNSNYTLDLTFYNPTKYIFWVLQREDVYEANFYDNYTYSFNIKYDEGGTYRFNYDDHLLKEAVIVVNNQELTSITDSVFLSSVQMYDKFNNGSTFTIYSYSFALDPNNLDPTGSLNFSKVLYKNLRLSLTNTDNYKMLDQIPNKPANVIVRTYSCNMNFLMIKDGLGGLVFTNN